MLHSDTTDKNVSHLPTHQIRERGREKNCVYTYTVSKFKQKLNDYEIYYSSGTCQVDRNGDELTKSGNQYLGLPPQIKFCFDDICQLKEHQENDEVPHSPFDVTPPTTPTITDPILKLLQSQFTGPQIQALVEMLAKMNDKGGGGGESEANISAHFNNTASTLIEAM